MYKNALYVMIVVLGNSLLAVERKAHIARGQETAIQSTPQETAVHNFFKKHPDRIERILKSIKTEVEKRGKAGDFQPLKQKNSVRDTISREHTKELADLSPQNRDTLLEQLIDQIYYEQLQAHLPTVYPTIGTNIIPPLLGTEFFKFQLLQTINKRARSIHISSDGSVIAINTSVYIRDGASWHLTKTFGTIEMSSNGSVILEYLRGESNLYLRQGTEWKNMLTHKHISMSTDGAVVMTNDVIAEVYQIYVNNGSMLTPTTRIEQFVYRSLTSDNGTVIAINMDGSSNKPSENQKIYVRHGNEWNPTTVTETASAVICDDASVIAATMADKTILYIREGATLTPITLQGEALRPIMNYDGSVIILKMKEGNSTIYARNKTTLTPLTTIPIEPRETVKINRNGSIIAVEGLSTTTIYVKNGTTFIPTTINNEADQMMINDDGSVIALRMWNRIIIYVRSGTELIPTTINEHARSITMNNHGSVVAITLYDKTIIYTRTGNMFTLSKTIDKPEFTTISPDGSIVVVALKDSVEVYEGPHLSDEAIKNITPAQRLFIQTMSDASKPNNPMIMNEQEQKEFDALFARSLELKAWLEKKFSIKTMQSHITMLYKQLESSLTDSEKKDYSTFESLTEKRAWLQEKLRQKKPQKKEIIATDRGDTKRAAASTN